MASKPISALLIDLSGTLHVGDTATPRAIQAVAKLRRSNIPFRFCSNTTKESSKSLIRRLERIGFDIKEEELYTSLTACRRLVEEKGFKPYYILSDSALEDFEHLQFPLEECDSVLVGLAPERLDYEHLNIAFKILAREPLSKDAPRPPSDSPRTLIATHLSTHFQSPTPFPSLSLGPGPFIHALSNSTSPPTPIIKVGKPSPTFFQTTLHSIPGLTESQWADAGVVGDDWKGDLEGGVVGRRFLVKTGKYRDGDEEKVTDKEGLEVWDCFADLVDGLVGEGEGE